MQGKINKREEEREENCDEKKKNKHNSSVSKSGGKASKQGTNKCRETEKGRKEEVNARKGTQRGGER